jgi:hypothetical protein
MAALLGLALGCGFKTQHAPDMADLSTCDSGACDDGNPCTTDTMSGCACMHVDISDGRACTGQGAAGVCISGSCCTGCISNGVCRPGDSDAKQCGKLGGDCFDCTANAASATCTAGQCSGCDQTSCTNEGRTCGTSSCGVNCGTCEDSCVNGAITHYACANKSCQQNGGDNCGLYAACKDGHNCKIDANGGCSGDGDCVASAWCSMVCKPKVGIGQPCSAEDSGDHECQSPYVCTWDSTGKAGLCVSVRCTGCRAGDGSGGCTNPIAYLQDPRDACVYTDECHQGFCSGFGGCDSGFDTFSVGRPCGAGATCTPQSATAGILTGSICTSMGCKPGQSVYCGGTDIGSGYSCPCANATSCSFTNCVRD